MPTTSANPKSTLGVYAFPLTQPNGATIFVTPHDLFEAADINSKQAGECRTIILHDYMQGGTDLQQRMLFEATVEYIKSLNEDRRPYTLWYEECHDEEESSIEDTCGSYEVRQPDGTFRPETVEQVIRQLVSGNYRKLQIKGSVKEKEDFIKAIRRRVEGMKVVIGRDITRNGAIEFDDGDGQRHRLDDRIEWLEKDFEEMVLDGMEAVGDEEDLAEGVNKLDVKR